MIMRMEAGLDTGPVAMSEKLAIGPDMTAGELHDALAQLGSDLIHRALSALARGALNFTPQSDQGATYATKIAKSETQIDWSVAAQDVHNHIRGLSPHPGAWFEYKGERIKVLRSALGQEKGSPASVLDNKLTIACGEGSLRLLTLQRPGKQAMSAEEFLRGFPVSPGEKLM